MSWGCSEADAGLCAGLISPRAGAGVCARCFDITAARDGECPSCARNGDHISALAPISYSIGGERLHHDIATYKRLADPSVPAAAARISELLTRFLTLHEHCLAITAGAGAFDLVTTVPSGSGSAARDEHHPLRRIVASIEPTAGRHQRLLLPAPRPRPVPREFNPARYRASGDLSGQRILLIDDMWTTGASAQSAAAALRAAGAAVVAAVVVARHLNRGWPQNDLCLRRLAGNFSWAACPLCANAAKSAVA